MAIVLKEVIGEFFSNYLLFYMEDTTITHDIPV